MHVLIHDRRDQLGHKHTYTHTAVQKYHIITYGKGKITRYIYVYTYFWGSRMCAHDDNIIQFQQGI